MNDKRLSIDQILVVATRAFGLAVTICTLVLPPATASAGASRYIIPSPGISEINVLSQNWLDDDANWFYNVAQGSKLLPYSWFLHLEQPNSTARFLDADYLRAMGYIPRSASAAGNPDGLPLGFVKDGEHLGLTCAACHTAQINFQGKGWLVDGGPTLADVETFQRRLAEALATTLSDPGKFDRFTIAVLGNNAAPSAKDELKKQLSSVAAERQGYNERNLPSPGSVRFGPGRVDAFGAIMNQVTSCFAGLPDNHAPANAPVSYPCLWDTPQHDKVQWNGAAQNKVLFFPLAGTRDVGALGRNIGEVLGVFGTLDASKVMPLGGYPSSANTQNLIQIEDKLRELWSPQWPAALGAISKNDFNHGQQLFLTNCASCHDPNFNRTSPDRRVIANMSAVGTDPFMAANFATRWAKTGYLEGRIAIVPEFRRFGANSIVSDMLTHVVQRAIFDQAFKSPLAGFGMNAELALIAPEFRVNAELQLDDGRKLSGEFSSLNFVAIDGKVREVLSKAELRLKDDEKLFLSDRSLDFAGHLFFNDGLGHRPDLAASGNLAVTSLPSGNTQLTFQQPVNIAYQYKARPLNGIWATAPYLHNGSVPNLDELLKPASKRVSSFKVGSREFDPEKVGFRVDQGDFQFDATIPGNSNAGHEYLNEFTDAERQQLIAYLKTL